jgi:two-component system LytT family sensor kinase
MPIAVGVALWCGLISLFAVQRVVVDSESWSKSLAGSCSIWLLWALFLPGIVVLSLRFPLGRPNIRLQIFIHLTACMIIVIINQVAYRTVIRLPPPPLEKQAIPIGPAVPQGKFSWVGIRIVPDTVIYLLILSFSSAFANFRRSQERERRAIELEAGLAEAKIQALRMQINPHFLFNTLNAISTLVHTSPHTADEMITDLSELFRVSLKSSDDQEIPLSAELELLQRYLTIEQRRFGERLRITQKFAPDILDALVPTLILQPIVENAIRHGIESHRGAGEIAVCARMEGDKLKLSVSDNGTHSAGADGRHAGVGLNNTRARLQLLYGDAQSLLISKGTLGGWTVELTMPSRRREEMSA